MGEHGGGQRVEEVVPTTVLDDCAGGFRASVEYFDMDMLVDYAEFVAALGQGDLDLIGEGCD